MIKFFFVFIVKFFLKYLIKFFEILFKKKILIIKIYCDRIGHMGVLTDNFLRKQQLQKKILIIIIWEFVNQMCLMDIF